MNFQVRVDGQARTVEIIFGGVREVGRLRRWRSPAALADNPHIRDAIEFSRLAAKRWRYYFRTGAAATSLAELQAAIRARPQSEIAFMLLARATWSTRHPILGLCHCRRTWCHHVIVDFAAAHPSVIGSVRHEIRGVGTGMFYTLVQIADQLGISTIWGEATVNSAPFYERVLGVPEVKDHFFITGPTLENVRREYEKFHGSSHSA